MMRSRRIAFVFLKVKYLPQTSISLIGYCLLILKYWFPWKEINQTYLSVRPPILYKLQKQQVLNFWNLGNHT